MCVIRVFVLALICAQCPWTPVTCEENRFSNIIWNSFPFFKNQPPPKDVAAAVQTPPPQPVDASTICVGCASNLYDEHEWESEITALRIEYIKNQILKKLRLKEKPSITLPIAGLPKPVTENENLFPRQDQTGAEYNDDYYGKTTQAIIFPHEGTFILLPIINQINSYLYDKHKYYSSSLLSVAEYPMENFINLPNTKEI